ncbi:fimbrial protein [Dyella tabacisoli]|uniref:Type 1 fimbrial protein n=1 Tax=Dyella tabacisoli TaxID=2282381 RepID=A0A369UMC2_9GAMM|nr:fimbrial protein [Dyella tabacisoli]RDD80740.1 type 1 fimbrial protein [Dyella tabacisoli]
MYVRTNTMGPGKSDGLNHKCGKIGARGTPRMMWLLLALVCLGWMPSKALAVHCHAATSTLSLPSVTVAPSTPVGALLGTPVSVTMTFTCTGLPYDGSTFGQTATIQAGNLAPRDASDPVSGGGIVYATNVPGIALKLTANPIQASDNACIRCGPGNTPGFEAGAVTYPANSISETFTAQWVKTGPVTAGTVRSIRLMQFYWYIYGISASSGAIANLNLGAGSKVSLVACSVNMDSQNLSVVLPQVSTSAFASVGATTGKTPFKVNLTCQSGSKVSITMTTAKPGTAVGVIAPTIGAGFAAHVGVQLLNGSNAPVTFNSAQPHGATPNGTLSIPYFAQYYRTASPVGSGRVKATATFNLTYQ